MAWSSFWRVTTLTLSGLLIVRMVLLTAMATAQFDAIYNLPGDTLPAIVGSNSQVNVGEGSGTGVIQFGETNSTSTNIELNVQGGTVTSVSNSYGGVTVNLYGSNNGNLRAYEGVVANYLTGVNELVIISYEGSEVNVLGGQNERVSLVGGTVKISGGTTGYMNLGNAATLGELYVTGGYLNDLYADEPSLVHQTGGAINRLVSTDDNQSTIFGGRIGSIWNTTYGGDVTIIGSQFELDGVPIAGLETVGNEISFVQPTIGGVLSAVLEDGSTIAIGVSNYDGEVAHDPLVLRRSTSPAASPSPINLPADPTPAGLRAGQVLTVGAGATLPPIFAAHRGSVVNLQAGGEIGHGFRATAATVNVSGGTLGPQSQVQPGTVVYQSGGRIGSEFTVLPGGTFAMSGGTIADGLQSFTTYGAVRGQGNVELYGGDFEINGVPVAGLDQPGASVELRLTINEWLTGVLADGTPIALSDMDSSGFGVSSHGIVTLVSQQPAAPVASNTILNHYAPELVGIRGDQTIQVLSGGSLGEDFNAGVGSMIRVDAGGSVGNNLEVTGGYVHLNGGSIGHEADLLNGSHLQLDSGSIEYNLHAYSGSSIEIQDGSTQSIQLGNETTASVYGGSVAVLSATAGSLATIKAGAFGSVSADSDNMTEDVPAEVNLVGATSGRLTSSDGSIVRMMGGLVDGHVGGSKSEISLSGGVWIDDTFDIRDTEIRVSGGIILGRLYLRDFISAPIPKLLLFGTEFYIDGQPVNLAEGESQSITERGIELSGVLSDGSTFEFDLSSQLFVDDYLSQTGELTITRVSRRQGDFSDDAAVDGEDFLSWQKAMSTGSLDADADHDGLVTEHDGTIWGVRYGTDYSRPGDQNHDGTVDGGDFLSWQADSQAIAKYDRTFLWHENFGGTYVAESAAHSVPEPSAMVAALLGGMTLGTTRRMRRGVSR
ncbi:hypothetical protein [Adhaeretor mobilis]|uniref:Uncharacterized protein n=1 Tax=Adhaeretor mobilis TaxID=1930276 RepID=A0A517MUA3_9BACT|nr:hypothetical protein [Adhaeretor mobilis]QDS98460.1 hypothetical protein HG15A2_17390 [Adhaeretor mobilis]